MTWTEPKDFTDATTLPADDLDDISNNLSFLKTHIALEEAAELEIEDGVITVTQGYHKITGEGDTDDDLVTIGGGEEGMIIILTDNGQTITLKSLAGNLTIDTDLILSNDRHIMLICDASGNWQLLLPVKVETILANTFICPAPGTDWTPQLSGAGLAASLTTKKCWIPLTLQVGDKIVSYTLVGDATEAAALTLDCKLVRINEGDPITTTDIDGGGITQIAVDGDFRAEAILTDAEIVAADTQYALEILGTTGVGDSITVIGAEIAIQRID